MADTTVNVKTSTGLKVRIAIGLGALVVIAIVAYTYRFAFSVAILSSASILVSAYVTKQAFQGYMYWRLTKARIRQEEAEARILEARADKAQAERHFVETKSGVFVLAGIDIVGFFPNTPAVRNAQTAQLEASNQPVLPDKVLLEQYASNPTLRSLFLGVGLLNGSIQPISYPLSKMVHVAVAGASGFGKSTFMQSIAWQILNSREGVKAILLDAQNVTFSAFVADENLLYPIASEVKDIAAILAELVEEMEQRQKLFSRWTGITDLETYNNVAEEKLPVMPVLFDEFGLVSDDKMIDEYITKLSRGGRKTGIFLMVGSQTWNARDLNSSFRANCVTTVQFKVRDKSTSRVLLGDSDAANIVRPGEARVILPGVSSIIPMQAPDPSNLIDVTPQLIDGNDWLAASRPIPQLKEDDEQVKMEQDKHFAELVRGGMSKREASMMAYGRDYAGNLVTRGKKALGEI